MAINSEKITKVATAITNKVTSLISSHNSDNNAHSSLFNGKANVSHTHGDITNDGKIGSDANKPLITTTSGKIATGSFGTSANTFCQGNDSRLSDARTPTAHNQAASTITDENANTYANIGSLSANSTQQVINNAINTKLGAMANIEYYEITTDKGTASASTMNKLYLVKSTTGKDDNYDTYITVRSGSPGNYNYAWEKIDSTTLDISRKANTADLSTVATSGSYADLTNKPSYTATVTSGTTGAYKIGSININGSNVDIYGKDTNTTYDVDGEINNALDALAESIYPTS